MTDVEQLADFVCEARWDSISDSAKEDLKIRVLDALGVAVGALDGQPVKLVKEQVREFGGNGLSTLIADRRTAPDRAALYNSALVRYLDFNDSYLAPNETCHPSDNMASVLAGAEYADAHGQDLLTALAVSYQVQTRLCDVAPVRASGFDHTTLGAFAAAAGTARALALDPASTANALAIAGTSLNALRVTRTGSLSHWKGLAAAATAFGAVSATFLAMRGITGPPEVFEGNKGFKQAISGPFAIDWPKEDLESVTRTILKKYNAEIHSQSAIEGLLELRQKHSLDPADLERIELSVFDVAYNIIGGGEEGQKTRVQTKEEADHSLPYLLAVAFVDGEVTPAQYEPTRITGPDVQGLVKKVEVRPDSELSRRFPDQHGANVCVYMRDGSVFKRHKTDYEGFVTNPMRWETVRAKFDRLATPYCEASLRNEIANCVAELDSLKTAELTRLLAQVSPTQTTQP